MNYRNIVISTMIIGALSACGGSSKKMTSTPIPVPVPTPTPAPNDLGISAVPETLKGTYTAALKFDRYTKVDTPNGGVIHIVAQDGVFDNQIVRSRAILLHFLTNYPGSLYGADKSAIANKMAENNAVLLLLNGVDDGTNAAAELDGQPLYYGEMQVEGHSWYVNQDYNHRDASYEEILHMVHDFGIGVDQNPTFIGAQADFQNEIRAAQVNASAANLWGVGATDWIAELTAENSLSQEYLAALIDVYYGLWGADTESSTHGMNGLYVAKVRNDIASKDPQGATLVDNKFFHPYVTYNARIDESFVGDFSLVFNANVKYTHHSQYLKDITLTGANDSNVIINQLDNNVTGNAGVNTVTFSGASAEYTITKENGVVTVQDMQDNRDGVNSLTAVEKMTFSDTTIDVSSL
jgi:hypothetical protein